MRERRLRMGWVSRVEVSVEEVSGSTMLSEAAPVEGLRQKR